MAKQKINLRVAGKAYQMTIDSDKEEVYRLAERDVNANVGEVQRNFGDKMSLQACLAITALRYRQKHPDAIIVGLDTQLAREWLADRDEAKLPDLIAIRFGETEETPPIVDVIEVKTHADYTLDGDGVISGHWAVAG